MIVGSKDADRVGFVTHLVVVPLMSRRVMV
jgi:hypothetical protein